MPKSAFIALFAAATAMGLTVSHAADLKLEAVDITEMKAVYGQIQPRNSVLARTRLGGTLVELNVTEGDIVKAGDVIAEVKDDKIDFQIKAVDAQLLGLRASLRDAEVELDRADRLVRSGATSTQRLDQLKTQLDVITNQVRQAEAQRSVLVQQASEGAVLAPSEGRVIAVPVTRDAVVMAGETVATIAGGGFFLRLAIPERHAQDLTQGAPIRIEAGGAMLEGELVKIYPQIEGGRVTADVEVDGLDTDFVAARVLVELPIGKRQALVVPAASLSNRSGVNFVAVRENDKIVERAVIAGRPLEIDGQKQVEILSGLVAGDVVVTE
ncbi:RND family efflux transporter MFP subunit [Agrobacterium albertimagni AOL15]|uniref:RND family efflux transporter MFP subunit n=1 Tax=Agrobacterium albertimagni AOL15 TaxID=1156935 RepID=K2QAN3_9HYPH|nr:efflux RND transporter periplasmic adaptor subunit [Agrobacterium albertimagni]EKF60934.1 RND family efflux transporter MFP subunit [Agrobacterium albertimagni AOL15]